MDKGFCLYGHVLLRYALLDIYRDLCTVSGRQRFCAIPKVCDLNAHLKVQDNRACALKGKNDFTQFHVIVMSRSVPSGAKRSGNL